MLSNSRLFLFILWVKVHFFEWSFLLNSLKTETSRSKILGVLVLLFENICFVFIQGDAFKSCTIHYTNLHFNSVALENLSQIPLYLFSSPVPNAQMHKYSHGFLSNKEVGGVWSPNTSKSSIWQRKWESKNIYIFAGQADWAVYITLSAN